MKEKKQTNKQRRQRKKERKTDTFPSQTQQTNTDVKETHEKTQRTVEPCLPTRDILLKIARRVAETLSGHPASLPSKTTPSDSAVVSYGGGVAE